MLFQSTRGESSQLRVSPRLNFKEVALTGLAPDGGLYMPVEFPQFNAEQWQGQSYISLAQIILQSFVGDSLTEKQLQSVLAQAYSSFPNPDIIPLTHLEDNLHLMELYHGPTHSFKDVAMQFIGALFDQMLSEGDAPVTILGATSGDTGSAAISAFAGKNNCRIIMLHPKGRISEVQRKQMTTVLDDNVLNVAIEGDFDQCQAMVKTLMSDTSFKARHALTTVNSINWARIAAQSVYYAYFSSRLLKGGGAHPRFVVPSGNFGNAFSAHVARLMGFPVGRVHVATNANDGLTQLIEKGTFTPQKTTATLSPAMDIQWASNYERLLFALGGADAEDLQRYIQAYNNKQATQMSPYLQEKVGQYFSSQTVSEAETKDMMRMAQKNWQKEIDPHTAVGLSVAKVVMADDASPIISLATAHPAKFPETFVGILGQKPVTPKDIDALWEKEERYAHCAAEPQALMKMINEGILL